MIHYVKPLAIGAATVAASVAFAVATPASAAPFNAPSAKTASHFQQTTSAQDDQVVEHRRKARKRWERGRGYRQGYRGQYYQPYRQPVYREPYQRPAYRQPYRQSYYAPYAPRNYSEPVYYNTHVWRERGYNNYYCRRRDGTTGLLIGAALGGLLGNQVAYRGERAAATVLGALNGAAIGQAIDGGRIRCR